MRLLTMTVLICLLATPLAMRRDAQSEMTEPQRIAYAVGHDLGTQTVGQLSADGVAIDVDVLVQGFSDAVRGVEPALSPIDRETVLKQVEQLVATRIAEQRLADDPVFRAIAEENLRRGRDFCRRFAEREGAIKLPSGVLYEVRESGEGESPAASDTVVVTFRGALLDGTVFAEGDQVSSRPDAMVAGGREILMMMRPGDRWRVVLPPEQAFGLGGRGVSVGPNETVMFDVSLTGVER